MVKKKRVLVCEDDPIQLAILTSALGRAGYETASARTPDEGLRSAVGQPVHAVVTDVHLQQGSAFDLLASLRRANRDAPTLMISGLVDPALRERSIRAGVRGLLEKPCDIPSIVRVVGGLLGRSEDAAPEERPILLSRPEIVGRADGRDPAADSLPEPVRRVGILVGPPAEAPARGLQVLVWAAALATALAGALAQAL